MTDKIETEKYISRKEYLKKYNSNVGYALHVQNNIKKDDYARLNTGQIVKVIEIKENNVNKKAIYYGFYDTDWFDSSAVEKFSKKLIDLIQVGDYVNGCKVLDKVANMYLLISTSDFSNNKIFNYMIKSILTKEQYEQNCYKVVE